VKRKANSFTEEEIDVVCASLDEMLRNAHRHFAQQKLEGVISVRQKFHRMKQCFSTAT
jgi:hypothetical protein